MKNEIQSAFPHIMGMSVDKESLEISLKIETGMTLRDYFAAKAMQGLIKEIKILDRYFDENMITTREEITASISEISYDYADAMIKARES